MHKRLAISVKECPATGLGMRHLWIRLYHEIFFLRNLENDIRMNYIIAQIVKLIVIEQPHNNLHYLLFGYYSTLIQEGYMWIGS